MDSRPGSGGSVFAMAAMLGLTLVAFAGITLWDEAHGRTRAPGFSLVSTGHENGTDTGPVAFTLEDYRGKTVVLDFMAVACTTCRAVTDDVLRPMHSGYAGPGFAILSIDTWADPGSGNSFGGETAEDLVRLQNSENIPWRHALDTDDVYVKYSAVSLPKLVVVDAEGRIIYAKTGSQDRDDLERAVEASLAGDATPVRLLSLGLAGLAFAAGLASILTPCSVGLLPAYLGLLLQDAAGASTGARTRRVLRGGLAAAAGIILLYGLLAALFWVAGRAIQPALPYLGAAVGGLMIAAGGLALAGTWPRITTALRLGKGPDARRGFFAFGISYALAGFACTGPLFLPILVAGFAISPAWGVWTFLLYAFAVALAVVVAAALVAAGEQTALRRVLDKTKPIQAIVSILLIGAGIYLVWYAAKANHWY